MLQTLKVANYYILNTGHWRCKNETKVISNNNCNKEWLSSGPIQLAKKQSFSGVVIHLKQITNGI